MRRFNFQKLAVVVIKKEIKMVAINTNLSALSAQYNLNKTQNSLDQSMERLSSGKRINSAADDAAGLAISSRMESQVRALNMTIRNANDGISLVSSVEGALQESTNILQRMYELSTQATNSTYNDSDRASLQDEISQLQSELDRIASDTEFNGQKVIDGSFTGKSLNAGFSSDGLIEINIGDHSADALSADGTSDALMNLMSSVSQIAIGVANQESSTSTVQSAAVKVDSQEMEISQTQFNIGQDNTQTITSVTSVANVSAGSNTETFTTKAVGEITIDNTSAGLAVGHGLTTAVANGAVGADSYTLTTAGTDNGVQIGAVIGITDGSATVDYTIRAEDIKETNALTLETIATNLTAAANEAGTLDLGTITSSAGVISMTGSAGVLAASANNTAAAVGISELNLSGDFEAGDQITVFGRGTDPNEASTTYTVLASDVTAATAALRLDAVATSLAAHLTTNKATYNGTFGAVAGTAVVTLTGTVNSNLDLRVEIDTKDGRNASAAAGTDDNDIIYVDSSNSDIGLDEIVDKVAYKLEGLVKFGDQISVTASGTGAAAVTHTVDADDLDADATITKQNAIDSFVSLFNNSDVNERFDATGGVLTASRFGDDTLVFTASVASATDISTTGPTVTDRTAGAQTFATSATAADGSVAGFMEVTLDGSSGADMEEGDIITMTTATALGSALTYTILREDIGQDDDETLANVRQKLIDTFNAGDVDSRTDLDSGLITASAKSGTTGVITFTGTTTTSGADVSVTLAETNATATRADGTDLFLTTITAATNNDGSAVGPYEDDNRVATASTKVVKFDSTSATIEVGDTVSMTVGDTTVSHTAVTGENTAEYLAAALAELINDPLDDGVAISTDAAGIITASANNGTLTLTSTNTGSSSDFDVSVSTTNKAAEAQVSAVLLDGAADLEVGDTVKLSLTTENFIEVDVTQDMVNLGAAGAREAVRDAMVAQSDLLQNVNITADADDTDKLILTGTTAGVSFTATMTETDAVDSKQVDTITIGGEVGRGDVFTVQVGNTATAAVSVGEDIASLRTNDERITAVRDALVEKIGLTNAVSSLLTSATADGDASIKLTAATAGTAIDSSSSTTTNNASVANQTQIDSVILSGDAEEGDIFTITLDNGSSASYTVTAEDAAGDTAEDRLSAARDGLVSAASSSLSGVTVSSGEDAALTLTSTQAGIGFETSVSQSNGSDVSQIEQVAFSNVEAGDTFTVTVGSETMSYTAVDGDDASSVASYISSNGAFSGKSMSVSDGNLLIEGGAGESFTVSTSTSNFAGGIQSDEIAITGTVETDDVYSVTIDGVSIDYSVQQSDSTMSDVVSNLADAINASSANANVTATVNDDGNLVISGNENGLGYTSSFSVSDVGRSRDSVAAIDISTESGANAAIAVIEDAIGQVNETRSELGAIENRLNHTISNLGNVVLNTEASKGRIEDVDFASETTQLTKTQILSQAATSMLAQANASKQMVLSLLQG